LPSFELLVLEKSGEGGGFEDNGERTRGFENEYEDENE
jgi:hypothetical protein